jgi:negative regulator of flagellin synthesis FlgM
MKINQIPGVASTYQKTGARKVAKGQDSSVVAKGDAVHLSKEAQTALAMKEKLNQASEVRAERVADLRRQLEAGTYRPDGQAVATKMLQSGIFNENG